MEDYPQSWSYRLVCNDEIEAEQAVKNVLGSRHFELSKRNTSKQGRFSSMDLVCIVNSEDDRKGINNLLLKHTSIKMIL